MKIGDNTSASRYYGKEVEQLRKERNELEKIITDAGKNMDIIEQLKKDKRVLKECINELQDETIHFRGCQLSGVKDMLN